MWWRRVAHIFKAVFAELYHQMKEDEHGEPQTPQHHLLHPLHVQHAKDEDELVEDEVPELIFQMLWDGEEHKSSLTSRYVQCTIPVTCWTLQIHRNTCTQWVSSAHYGLVMRGWRLYPRALRMIRGSGNKVHSDYLRVDKINH